MNHLFFNSLFKDLIYCKELTKKEDEEFPKAFDVVEYEYYGGEIESVAD